METYVKFDIAKQLVSIGFSEPVHMLYDEGKKYQFLCSKVHESPLPDTIPCPTQQQVVEWFIEKHGLLILVDYDYYLNDKKFHYGCSVVETGELDPDEEYAVLRHDDNSLFDNRSDAINRGIDMCIGLVFQRMAEKKFEVHTMEDVFRVLDENLDEESKEYLLKSGALHCHHTIGRWIRNEFGLWGGKSSLYRLLSEEKGLLHPDTMSQYVLEEYLKYLRKGDEIPDDDYVPFEVIEDLVLKGFPVMSADDWYCAYDGAPDRNSPITRDHYPLVTQNRIRKWLKRKHDIYISVSPYSDEDRQIIKTLGENHYEWQILRDSTGEIIPFNGCGVTEYEAVNEAISYCLKNLI